MKKQLFISVSVLTLLFSTSCSYANWLNDIFQGILRLEKTQRSMLASIDGQTYALNDIDSLMKQVEGSLTGNSGWGTYNFHDYQSYGGSASNWEVVLKMSDQGKGGGALGGMIGGIANQFPADRGAFSKGINNTESQKYYALKTQTVLATRAASQLDYNKVQEQITYQQMLQQQIEKTKDLKAAVDLLNRIQVEGNLINLEVLRQVALSNQQQAVTEQATVNAALSNARFLTKH